MTTARPLETAPPAPAPARPPFDRPAVLVAAGLLPLLVRDGRPAWAVLRIGLLALAWWWLDRRAGEWQRLLGGAIGATAGLVIAAGYVTHAGVSPVAVAGTCAGIGGLWLAARAVRRLLAARHGVARVVPALAVVAVLQLVVLPLVGAVHATNVPPSSSGDRDPSDLGLAYEDVRLETSDGVALAAWFVPGGDGRAVLLLHGAGSSRSRVLDHAAVLHGEGFATLLLDTRGHGDSGGDAMDFGWYGDRDVAAAIDWLSARADVDPGRLGVLGLSMGGEQAITAAAGDDRIAAVVAEGATQRVPDDARWQDDGATGPVRSLVDRLTYGVADLLTSASPPEPLRDAVRSVAPRPILFVAGSPAGELEAAERYRAAAPQAVTIWHVPDTPQTDALERHPGEWRREVTAFFEAALGR